MHKLKFSVVTGSGLETMPPTRYQYIMERPVGIEFDGALYHVTSRGDRREDGGFPRRIGHRAVTAPWMVGHVRPPVWKG